ncbi:hypothetical protein NEOLI_001392 [Neolecta irregularis DAH-3]|uniref:C2 domain-containing protein n=1 Tax=Neolecta irregularis (strain DAH-3) TaxID=1198029 RepID=A0A1U7LT75_NEOID|nr:hypothetical protein NEOLI_001392 [Neolecta irregularis DAH-3]|eukprot:OLL25875.1 hypothetical protein NEOLI_001392 [Neolecta irregularis DAH-3]
MSSKRRKGTAARRTTRIASVTNDQIYDYTLKAAYLAYLSDPATRRAIIAQSAHRITAPKSHKSTYVSAVTDILRDTENPGKNKLPKELVKILRVQLQNIFMGRHPNYNDPLVRATFGVFYGAYTEPRFYKRIKEDRNVEELTLIFVTSATNELRKRVEGDDWKPMIDRHIALFLRLIQDCMKQHNFASSHAELMNRLEGYEQKLLRNTGEILGQAPQSNDENIPFVSFKVVDMPLVQHVLTIFQKSAQVVQKSVNSLRDRYNEHIWLQDLKLYATKLNISSPDLPNVKDFESEEAYITWKERELQIISRLMLLMLQNNPSLNQTTPGEIRPSLLSSSTQEHSDPRPRSTSYPLDLLNRNITPHRERMSIHTDSPSEALANDPPQTPAENSISPTFAYIPDDPKSYYRQLVDICLSYDLTHDHIESHHEGLFTPQTSTLLSTCAETWRIQPHTQQIILLDVLRCKYDEAELENHHIQAAFEDFRSSDWDMTIWTIADTLMFGQILVRLNESLLRSLYDVLQHCFEEKPPPAGPILGILQEFIHPNPLFQESAPDLTGYCEQLKEGIQSKATEIYNSRVEKVWDELNLEVIHISQLAEDIMTDISRLDKRYKKKVLGHVDIVEAIADMLIPQFFNDADEILSRIKPYVLLDGKLMTSLEDMFELYMKMIEIRMIYEKKCRAMKINFDLEAFFQYAVQSWLETTDAKTSEWVDRAISMDKFVAEDDGQAHSSSVVDLFASFTQAVGTIKNLQWRDEYMNARFMTTLSKTIDRALSQYCRIIEEMFATEMFPPTVGSPDQAPHERWLSKAKDVFSQEKLEPFILTPTSCVQLNNIEFARMQLDNIEKSMDVDHQAEIILRNTTPTTDQARPERMVFTIKIVQAEDLKPCDLNGLSDPYVVLSDEHGHRLAKTRTIYASLNPRWEESFDVITDGPIWVAATVWDRDRIGDHDICGRCLLKLDPKYFGDYLPKEFWLDLDTQGRLLLRISMEGEKDDIQFYFGRAFRSLKRAENDMTRVIVDKMSDYIGYWLSRNIIKKLLNKPLIDISSVSNLFNRTKLTASFAYGGSSVALSDNEIENAIGPLLDYFETNFATLSGNLSDSASLMVMSRVWKEILVTIEDMMIPPLSDRPSDRKPLEEAEVDVLYKWLEFLRNYFNANGDGVPLDVLQTAKYREIMSLRFFYDQQTQTLIQECERIASESYDVWDNQQKNLRNKSVLNQRNLGTIRRHKQEKMVVQQLRPNDDALLRILRMRPEAELYLKERFRQRSRLNSQAVIETGIRKIAAKHGNKRSPKGEF